jgi:hypothetical protein
MATSVHVLPIRRLNKSRYLSRMFGGLWVYDGVRSWYDQCNHRFVTRCSSGVDEWGNSLGTEYWMRYSDGANPRRVYFTEGLDK